VTEPARQRHRLGCIKVRPSAEALAAVLRPCAEGWTLKQLCAALPAHSRRMVWASAEDAIAAGLVVRCGSGSRNFRYAAAEHAAAVQALIRAQSVAARSRKRVRAAEYERTRMRRRRHGGDDVARAYALAELEERELAVRRVIVPAGSVPPPYTVAPRSVWEFGA
jgi:hypothetical protein